MMWILRILFGAAFAYFMATGWETGSTVAQSGDLQNAFNLAVLLILGLANGIVWAPLLGAKLSDPLTGTITGSTYVDRNNYLLRLIFWLQERGYRRWTVFFCFLEGIHYPDRPTAFVIGLKNAKPGSWLEKVYAREVFKYDNAQNCVQAHAALKRHGIDPGRHRNPEINIVLMSLERAVKPPPEVLAVPEAAPPPALRRNQQIRLFAAANTGGANSEPEPPAAEVPNPAMEPSRRLSENSALGSTGYQPVPSGDSPDGTTRASAIDLDARFPAATSPVPVGGSPTGAGESPAPPNVQTGARDLPANTTDAPTGRSSTFFGRMKSFPRKP